ncbi:MAG: hypothetical protein RLZZ08_671 [Pseudomonadota bacterium]|jgi:uncharacterized protein (TIGR02246 family)
MKYAILLAAVPMSLLAACSSAVDPNAVKETVGAVQAAQMEAIASDDIDGATRVFSNDAVMLLPDGTKLAGAEAIKADYTKMLADKNTAVKLTPAKAWASEGGDLAVTTGSGEYTSTGPDGKPVTVAFDNQTVWRKADSGPWLIVSDLNYVLPAAK